MLSRTVLRAIAGNEAVRKVSDDAMQHGAVPVYRLRRPAREVVAAEARRWAHLLGVANGACHLDLAEAMHPNRLVLTHAEGVRIRGYFDSGCLDYRHLQRAWQGSTDIDSMDAARAIAEQFLGRYGLWPPDSIDQLQPHRLSFVSSRGVHGPTGALTEIVRNNTVLAYRRHTRAIPWIGPGAGLACLIEGRDVVGYTCNWRPVVAAGLPDAPVLPLEEALAGTAAAALHPLFGEYDGGAHFEVGQVEFGYFAADRWTAQAHLEPAYRLVVRVRGQAAIAVSQVLPAHHGSHIAHYLPHAEDRPGVRGNKGRCDRSGGQP